VGIAVYCSAVKGSTYDGDVEDKKLQQLYGPALSVTIYTGKISYVGEHHIEYDINTYRRCSGAIVFLLEHNEQHPSVKGFDCGKAIAVHAGFKEALGTNIGFKLVGNGASHLW
jgi:hypothetical protein